MSNAETKCPHCGAKNNPDTLCGIKWIRDDIFNDRLEEEWYCLDCDIHFKVIKHFEITNIETQITRKGRYHHG